MSIGNGENTRNKEPGIEKSRASNENNDCVGVMEQTWKSPSEMLQECIANEKFLNALRIVLKKPELQKSITILNLVGSKKPKNEDTSESTKKPIYIFNVVSNPKA